MIESGLQVYSQGQLTFIITPQKIVVRTNLGQQFYLLPKAHYFTRRLNLIKTMIALEEIRDLNELATWCGGGISWEVTSQNYTLAKAQAMA